MELMNDKAFAAVAAPSPLYCFEYVIKQTPNVCLTAQFRANSAEKALGLLRQRVGVRRIRFVRSWIQPALIPQAV